MKRILCVLPLPYGHDWGFWTRDVGLMTLTLREMGYDAWLVALGDAATTTEGRPVLAVSLDDLRNPDWWRAQKPDGVVLCTWSAPRYDAVRKAALAVTPRVVERLDTSGNRSARLFPRDYYIGCWGEYWDKLPAPLRWLAPVLAGGRTALLYLFPQLMDVRMVETMKPVPILTAESPLSAERIQKMFTVFSGTSHRVVMVPHPVNETAFRYDLAPKENHLITVGRWASAQKDFPMLRQVLKGFLERHPDWRATIVGGGVPAVDRHPGAGAEEWRRRVTFHESLSHEKLAPEYTRSKIYLMVSRYESFCIAAAEALCCGCSVVGSCDVPSSYYFAGEESGAVAPKRSAGVFLETLDREVIAWNSGARNPEAIAADSRAKMSSHAVAETMLALLAEIKPWDIPAPARQVS